MKENKKKLLELTINEDTLNYNVDVDGVDEVINIINGLSSLLGTLSREIIADWEDAIKKDSPELAAFAGDIARSLINEIYEDHLPITKSSEGSLMDSVMDLIDKHSDDLFEEEEYEEDYQVEKIDKKLH